MVGKVIGSFLSKTLLSSSWMYILPILLLFIGAYFGTSQPSFAQTTNNCPATHPYFCGNLGPAGEGVCSANTDCQSQNITLNSGGPDCRQAPGYCETLSPSCTSGGGGNVVCNQTTGWCETVSCQEGLPPSSPERQASERVRVRVGNPTTEQPNSSPIGSIDPNTLGGWPVNGRFDIAQCPYSGGFTHGSLNAVDIVMAEGTPIYATLDGVITTLTVTGCNTYYNLCSGNGYGTHIIIEGNGTWALYGHLLSNSVSHLRQGQTVKKGDYLGGMGNTGYSTGVHLHYELSPGAVFPREHNICG